MNQDKSLLEETKPWRTKIEKSAADLDKQIQTPKRTLTIKNLLRIEFLIFLRRSLRGGSVEIRSFLGQPIAYILQTIIRKIV